ncbi:unnamed protein product [Toxocara canis]|uniref:Solute carrier family 40 member n=1 Tax=Toxocara canis TaxID=6265 RepID=A0A183V3E2_TOXCA|nr:unnamed protein product [Toxocara canis]
MTERRNFLRTILPSAVFRNLYLAYLTSCIGDRLWTFAVALVLQRIGGLRLVSINQLTRGITQIVLSTYVGDWLDKHNRKLGVLTVLALNNVNVALSAGMLSVCLSVNQPSALYAFCLICSIASCALSTVASEGEKIAFTKDWVVEMAKCERQIALSRRNAVLRTIDQLSSVVAPMIAGVVLLKTSYRIACFIFVMWNLVSWVIEALLLIRVYHSVPALSVRSHLQASIDSPKQMTSAAADENEPIRRSRTAVLNKWCHLINVYWRQQVFPAAIALAFLYMTVLGFDGVAVSYGRSQGLTEDLLGAFRSIGSALGVAGAILYTSTERCIGVRKTGFIGFIAQQLMLYLCVVSIWLPGSPFDLHSYINEFSISEWWTQFKNAFTITHTGSIVFVNTTISSVNATGLDWSSLTADGHSIVSVCVLLIGIALARVGLWMADLSITQIMQEVIAERERNTVFGVQNACNQFFSVLKDIMVIVLPEPRTFGVLIIVSVIFVTSGFLSYSFYLLTSGTQNKINTRKYEEAKPTNATEMMPLADSDP